MEGPTNGTDDMYRLAFYYIGLLYLKVGEFWLNLAESQGLVTTQLSSRPPGNHIHKLL